MTPNRKCMARLSTLNSIVTNHLASACKDARAMDARLRTTDRMWAGLRWRRIVQRHSDRGSSTIEFELATKLCSYTVIKLAKVR